MSTFSVALTKICSLTGQSTINRTGSVKVSERIPVAAAKAGVVTSGTTDRLLTLGAGHGLTTASVVGVFWAAGQRLDMTVTAYDSTTITVTASSGVGDAFPANATVITVGLRAVVSAITFLATNLQILSCTCEKLAGVNFVSSVPADLLTVAIAAGESYDWASGSGVANPITGTVAQAHCYNGSTTATDVLIGFLIT